MLNVNSTLTSKIIALAIVAVLDILYASAWTDNLDFIPAYYDKGVFRKVKQFSFKQWLEYFYEGNGLERVNFEKHNTLMTAYGESVKAIKVRIKSEENPTFFSAESNELMVTGALHPSLFSGDNIITSFSQKLYSAAEETMVSQKFHLSDLLDRDLFVFKNRGSVMQAGLDVIYSNVRIALFYNIWGSHSLFKQFNNHIHRNTRAFNTGFAKTNCRVNRNSFHQIIRHFAYLQQQLYHKLISASSSIPSAYAQPAGLEQVYDIADVSYTGASSQGSLLRVPVGGTSNRVEEVMRKQTAAQTHSAGRLTQDNPLQMLNTNSDLRNFSENVLVKRYTSWGLPAELASQIIDKLLEHADEPEVARQALYRDVIRFKNNPAWLTAYSRYKAEAKYSRAFSQVRPFLDGAERGLTVVDMGAGNMELSEAIAIYYPNSQVIGSDTQEYFERRTLPPNLRFVLPEQIENGSADIVIMHAVLHHVDAADVPSFLSRIHKILKPHGRILLAEDTYSTELSYSQGADKDLTDKFLFYVRRHGPVFAQGYLQFNDWFANIVSREQVEMPMPYNFHSLEEWASIFQAQGFRLVELKHLGFPTLSFHQPNMGFLVFENAGARLTVPTQSLIKRIGSEARNSI